MSELKSGKTATEWITVAGVVLFAAAKMFGIVPEDATTDDMAAQATDALPLLINGVVGIVKGNSPLMIMAGLAWAYLKRRSSLKAKAMK